MNVILALYPNARGLNYACIEMPSTLLDYGLVNPIPFSIQCFLKRIEKFLDFFQPTVIVLRNVEGETFEGQKAQRLIKAIAQLAVERGLPVHSYSRAQIREVFEVHDARSKYEISQKIINWIPDLVNITPRPRKLWLPEDHRMGVFDAMALVIAHNHLMG